MEKEVKTGNYDLIFEKLEEAKKEQSNNEGITDTELSEIDENIKMLIDIQQSVDLNTYTYFTRS